MGPSGLSAQASDEPGAPHSVWRAAECRAVCTPSGQGRGSRGAATLLWLVVKRPTGGTGDPVRARITELCLEFLVDIVQLLATQEISMQIAADDFGIGPLQSEAV